MTFRSSPTSPRPRTSPAAVRAEAEPLPISGDLDIAFRIVIALVVGLALGTERELRGHPAGLKTMALISIGACMFTSLGLLPQFGTRVDPTRIAAQIVTGVGFLGAGSILREGGNVHGLTTAASIWVAASLGMAVGYGYYTIAIFTTVLVLITLIVLRPIEMRFLRRGRNRRIGDPPTPEPEL